ncbi:MAG: hypothetical protein ABEL76_03985 [Bradymonadaceae bacterium]
MTIFSDRILQRSVLGALLLLPMLAASTACGEPGFTFTAKSDEEVVPGSPGPGVPLDNFFPSIGFDINLERELDKRNAGPAKAVYLEGLDLKITGTKEPDGDTDNFDFLNSLKISANADGKDARQIGELDPVPEGQSRVSLETDDSVNLKPYIEKGMTLEVDGEGRPPDDDTSFISIVRLRVKIL